MDWTTFYIWNWWKWLGNRDAYTPVRRPFFVSQTVVVQGCDVLFYGNVKSRAEDVFLCTLLDFQGQRREGKVKMRYFTIDGDEKNEAWRKSDGIYVGQ